MATRDTPNFCSQCGDALSPGDAFCSQCGAGVDDDLGRSGSRATAGASAGGGASTRSARSGPRSDFRRRVEDLTVEGWDVKHDYGDRVVMINRGFGSIPVHLLLLVFTSGVGNVLYAAYRYSPGAERIELREDGTDRYSPGRGLDTEWSLSGAIALVASIVLGGFLAFAGLGLMVDSAILLGTAVLFVGVASVAFAAQFVPGFESPTTFGRRRTTDEEVVTAPETPCVACSRPVGTGVKRSFTERRYVAGVPVETVESGENHYCRSCANGDPFTGEFEFERATGEKSREFV
ncbi:MULTISPECIES: zinc ribbon domain-containing protein [Halorussus]|uniref:zinc ribbon domain-containing protein n=1 Tax=Halorussus TaxID=1070314 RepID=UPI00209D3713|nr:zinc ribbon domain-containing protein [Halorussus vallis]USZ75498.1 zinc ribbon domain-containing protein [Halorussus vallis]